MAYTKALFIEAWSSAEKLYHYLQNANHPNHQEYEIGRMQSALLGITPEEFFAKVKEGFDKVVKGKRGGRPLKNRFTLYICRVADASWMTPEELEIFAKLFLRLVVPDGLAMLCWHTNWLTGAADLNVLVPNIVGLDRPRVRRTRNLNPITQARHAADAAEELVNAARRRNNLSTIVTMPQKIQELATKRRGSTLEAELAAHPEKITLQNLRRILEELGHKVISLDEETDTVEIELRAPKRRIRRSPKTVSAKEQKRRKRGARKPRFAISKLLNDVALARRVSRRLLHPSTTLPKSHRGP